jgi:glycosyltransferase involved in cell wall biosynthesis
LLLPHVLATVIPRPRNRYNDLALPIKLFDYLSYGRPLLLTDCVEQARIVADAEAGIVTADGVEAMAEGINRVASAPPGRLDRWSRHAASAASAASWGHRARTIVSLFGIAPDDR